LKKCGVEKYFFTEKQNGIRSFLVMRSFEQTLKYEHMLHDEIWFQKLNKLSLNTSLKSVEKSLLVEEPFFKIII